MTSLKRLHISTLFLCIVFISALLSPQTAQAQTLKQLLLTPGDLTASHKEFEAQCEKCHVDFSKSAQTTLCLDCHEDINADINSNSRFHGINPKIKNTECKLCHTDHKGEGFDIINLDIDSFDHSFTRFPLEGQHTSTACTLCHTEKQTFKLEEQICIDCHEKQDSHNGQLGEQCSDCHNSSSWEKQQFDHEETSFPLLFKHQDVECSRCHIDEKYQDIGEQCSDCHQLHDVHQGAFGNDCASCHSEKDWQQSLFDHNTETDFKLLFSHQQLNCLDCHQQPVDSKTNMPQDCQGCHKNSDVHNGSNGDDCAQCHTEERWSKSAFDHQTDTDYPLLGKHKTALCTACHNPLTPEDKPSRQCIDCHKLADPHKESLGTSCANCHSADGWDNTLFSHDITEFPLIGMHRQVSCEGCHLTTRYEETPQACDQCHLETDTHDGSLGTDCRLCHNPNDWGMWLFNHDNQTSFPLQGAHTDLQCELCHTDSKLTPQTCFDCHRDDDVHRGSFGKRCGLCHSVENFDLIKRMR